MNRSIPVLLALLSASGCAGGMLYDGAAIEAIEVGKPAFGAPYDASLGDWTVPNVFVLPQERMNCMFGTGERVPDGTGQGWILTGKCVDGASFEPESTTLSGPPWIELAPKPTWHESALCHEMGHASRFMRGIDGDSDHVSETFAPGGPVETCQKLLTDAGL